YHCYANDTQLIFSFPPSDTTVSARISTCLSDISLWMSAHQLKLNPCKTELLIIPGDSSPGQDLQITLHDSLLSPSATACNLGVTMDNKLSFFPHVANVACRFLLYNIRRIRQFLSIQAAQVLVQSLVISRLDYCSSLLFSHTTPLLRSLHWLPVAARIRFKTLMLAYKAKNGPAPSYLSDLITSRTAPRCLRSSSTARLVPPSLRMRGKYILRLFSVLAPRWWNELPLDVRTAESLIIFKR
ncbi:hypothetical protein HF521_016727, partial [Silurus meridionalis]